MPGKGNEEKGERLGEVLLEQIETARRDWDCNNVRQRGRTVPAACHNGITSEVEQGTGEWLAYYTVIENGLSDNASNGGAGPDTH